MKSSDKRRRRTRDESSEDDDSGARRRSSRRDSKKRRPRRRSPSVRGRDRDRKRRKESKKPDKKKASKPRRRRDSSSSSCPTCRGRSSSVSGSESVRSRSRSASRVVKSRARDKSRGRDKSRRSSRYRSPSCSTCSGRSSSLRRSHRDEKSGEKDRSKRHRIKSFDEKERRYGSTDEDRDKIIQAYDDFRSSRSNDRYDGGRKQDSEMGTRASSQQVADNKGNDSLNSHEKDEAYMKGNEASEFKINTKHPKDSDDGAADYRQAGSSKINAQLTKNSVKGGEVALSKIGAQPAENAYDDTGYSRQVASSDIAAQHSKNFNKGRVLSCKLGTEPSKNAYDGSNDTRQLNFGPKKGTPTGKNPETVSAGSQMRKHSEVATDDGSLEAQDLELILRQKALENFRKFRGGIPVTKKSLGNCNGKDEDMTEAKPSFENAQASTKPIEHKPANPLENYGLTLGGDRPISVRLKSIASVVRYSPDDNVTPEVEGNPKFSSYTGDQNESSNKVSLEQPLLAQDVQYKRSGAEPGSDNPHGSEVAAAEGSALGTACINIETEDSKSNEPMMEDARGGQFEQKTFSTMRGGEIVQVSYKVYIPPNSRALARRQLRR